MLAGRESGKKSAAAEEARDFSCLFVSRRARRGDSERRLNELQKRAQAAVISADPRGGRVLRLSAQTPEAGASRGYQRGPQRRAGDTKAAAAATKKPVCEHRSLSTPPLPGACAARHCQGPGIQGQLPRGRTHSAPQAAATLCWPLLPQARPASSVLLPPPSLSEPEPPKQLLL